MERYLLENSDYNGYNQGYSLIGDWKMVLEWAKDGSIKQGDKVFKLVECVQPRIIKEGE